MNLKDLVQSLLIYVGIPAVTLYPLGFAALAIQLWSDPLFPYYDLNNIWYAVALVREVQVVTTGLRLIFLSLVATALGAGIALWVSRALHRREGRSVEEKLEGGRRGVWAIYLLILLPMAVFLTLNGVLLDSLSDLIALFGFVVLTVGVGILVGYMRARGPASLLPAWLAVAYIGAVFAALCLAAINPPSLPLVRIDAELGAAYSCNEASDETFVLLATDETHWFVFNRLGLYAVPARQLKLVQFERCPWYEPRGIEPSVELF